METKDLDVVYVLKQGVQGDELRYSIRSLKNLPHRNVWVYGDCPEWLTGVFHVPTEQKGIKWENTSNMYLQICSNPNISDKFIIMNDDFYILEPIEKLDYYYSKTLPERIEETKIRAGSTLRLSRYGQQLQMVEYYLTKNHYSNLNYELHIPMIFDKKLLKRAIKKLPNRGYAARRSLYANVNELGGIDRPDCKIYDITTTPKKGEIFCSTADFSFRHGRIKKYLQEKFKEKSIHEH